MHVSIFERAGASTITYFSPYGQQVHSHHITFVKFPLPQYLFTNTSMLITLIDCMFSIFERAGASTNTYFSPYVQQVTLSTTLHLLNFHYPDIYLPTQVC